MAKILIIEDDRTMLSLLTMLLNMEGFQVLPLVQAPELEDILAQIQQTLPDVALVDVNLRTFNGLDLLIAIRKDIQLNKVRVLMSSGIELGERCMASGADGFILKPYMPETLIQKLKQLVEA